jgi:ATP-dependent Clp protease protease subunit
MERDRFMNAQDAKTYGLIDEVLDKRAVESVKSA